MRVHDYQPELKGSETGDLLGAFEKVLLVSNEDMESYKDALESNFYEVESVETPAAAVRKLLAEEFQVILCDAREENFPAEMFCFAVNQIKPHLCGRIVFLSDEYWADEETVPYNLAPPDPLIAMDVVRNLLHQEDPGEQSGTRPSPE